MVSKNSPNLYRKKKRLQFHCVDFIKAFKKQLNSKKVRFCKLFAVSGLFRVKNIIFSSLFCIKTWQEAQLTLRLNTTCQLCPDNNSLKTAISSINVTLFLTVWPLPHNRNYFFKPLWLLELDWVIFFFINRTHLYQWQFF